MLCQNQRLVTFLASPELGLVCIVAVGSSIVGSVESLVSPGQEVAAFDELGFFQYGGSVVLVLFERGCIAFAAYVSTTRPLWALSESIKRVERVERE